VHTSTENLAGVWASVDRLCAGPLDSQWDLPTGGRSDVPGDVVITGDQQLGQRVLQSMGLMP
jgi:hypothetical protein